MVPTNPTGPHSIIMSLLDALAHELGALLYGLFVYACEVLIGRAA